MTPAEKERLTLYQKRLLAMRKQPEPPTVVVNIQMPDIVDAMAKRFGDDAGRLRTSGDYRPSVG